MKNIGIIGSGFSSISAACYLAKAGYRVAVFEQQSQLGGRARQFVHEGFKFDMGPTWYWMPDVFERFFADFGKKPSDYYELQRLSPAYKVVFDTNSEVTIGNKFSDIVHVFESIETGAGSALKDFIDKSKRNYSIAIEELVYRPGISPLELVSKETLMEFKQFFTSIRAYISKRFSDPRLRQILEFPVLFLGAKPSETPLFYSFMNYADFVLGTWHPTGGIRSVVVAMVELAKELGVEFYTDSTVDEILVNANSEAYGLKVNGSVYSFDTIISGADYKHSEDLLPEPHRRYSRKYWNSRVMAPSALLFYVGFDKKLVNLEHHTLFFDASFDLHAEEIYDRPQWPNSPLFYASFPSLTDATLAPKGKESGIFLIPLAPDLDDTEEMREAYFQQIIHRLETRTNQKIKESILFKRSYCVNDFKADYNSFKGNAYGMANTLFQTAFMRPKLRSSKVKDLFFTGQLTVPGPGVPPSIISGKLVSELIMKQTKKRHESVI